MQCIYWTRYKCWGFEFSLPIQFLIRLSCTYFSLLSLFFTTVLCLFHSNYELLFLLCVVFLFVLTVVKLILHFSASLLKVYFHCAMKEFLILSVFFLLAVFDLYFSLDAWLLFYLILLCELLKIIATYNF